MRKKFVIFSVCLSFLIILITVLYIGNGITDTVKESSKLRIYLWNNPYKLNIEWKDNTLDISLSSIYKAADYIKTFLIVNIADRFMDTFVYRNVY